MALPDIFHNRRKPLAEPNFLADVARKDIEQTSRALRQGNHPNTSPPLHGANQRPLNISQASEPATAWIVQEVVVQFRCAGLLLLSF
ncbi:hypothetical protein [Paraburkholderia sp. MM5477-R1]|uniref:hypothetical protein n=1 Tax=Paraburkholderia sp. MM5477-R1 TaxID=2991062 RepID=UPI003D237695